MGRFGRPSIFYREVDPAVEDMYNRDKDKLRRARDERDIRKQVVDEQYPDQINNESTGGKSGPEPN